MKIKKIIACLIMLIAITSLTGCLKEKDKETDALKFKEEYETYNEKETSNGQIYPTVNVDEDNIIKYLSLKEMNEFLEDKKTGVVYLGYSSCPWCRTVVPVLLDAADSTTLEKIYYVDMKDKRDIKEIDETGEIITTKEASQEYYDLLEKLDNILLDYTLTDKDGNEKHAGEKRIYVPLVLFVKDGEIINYHIDTVSSQTNPYEPLTEDQQIELYNVYSNAIHEVLGDVCQEEERC